MNKYISYRALDRIHPTLIATGDANSGTILAKNPEPDTLTISFNGSVLLRVSASGVVEGDIEDMGIAAAVFVREIRKQIDFPERARERIKELTAHNTKLTLENRALRERFSLV